MENIGRGRNRSVPEFLQSGILLWSVTRLTLFSCVDLNGKACPIPPRLILHYSYGDSFWISLGSLPPWRKFGPSKTHGPIRRSGRNIMIKSLIVSFPRPVLAKGGRDHGSTSPGMLILMASKPTSCALHGATVTGSSGRLMPICRSINLRLNRLPEIFFLMPRLTRKLRQDFTGR